ncbi:DUF86 domain-containing protein [Bacillus kwashiorkori]|uniref:DUF86 domain-containing protein n=1 Tax=Bacillus kwashiorkori TaxID=1522318 RepID=UPI000782F988|nr:DUF86 domain-containing protein [Bacillus kwashiorkori]
MYFVDRKKIENTLQFMEVKLKEFDALKKLHNNTEKLAFERVVHTLIEGVLDVGNAMIDGFIMRDPGSYNDIIDILEDEKVISHTNANKLKNIIALRKNLVHDYISVNHETILQTVDYNKDALYEFIPNVRDYLINEIGPVTAFKREEK